MGGTLGVESKTQSTGCSRPSAYSKEGKAHERRDLPHCVNVLGYASPRYTRVKGKVESVMKLQTKAFIHNFSSPKGLNAARRKFETYQLAM